MARCFRCRMASGSIASCWRRARRAAAIRRATRRAAGAWAAAAVPVKGQMLALAPVEGGPRHVIHTRDVYIAPKSRWVLVGATSERGRADTEVDRDGDRGA